MVETFQQLIFVSDVEDVANMVMFLLSEKAAMTTGSVIAVDGGHLLT